MKLRRFYAAKEMINNMKKQPIDSEKIFTHYTTNRGLIARIYNKLQKLNDSKINNL